VAEDESNIFQEEGSRVSRTDVTKFEEQSNLLHINTGHGIVFS